MSTGIRQALSVLVFVFLPDHLWWPSGNPEQPTRWSSDVTSEDDSPPGMALPPHPLLASNTCGYHVLFACPLSSL